MPFGTVVGRQLLGELVEAHRPEALMAASESVRDLPAWVSLTDLPPSTETEARKLAIVLDTNAFFGDVYANKPWLSAVLDGAAKGDFEVVVPETVVMELVKQFPGRLEDVIAETNSAIGRVKRELDRLDVPAPSVTDIDQSQLIEAYEDALRQRLSGTGCRVAPHPSELEAAVGWAINRRRPFKQDGEGFPDAVIWLTALTLASEFDEVLLVSTNKVDFGDQGDPPSLGADLVDDLQDRGLPPDRVRLLISVKTLVEEVVEPLAAADVRATRLLTDPILSERLMTTFTNSLVYTPIPQQELRLGVDLDNDPQPVALDVEHMELLSAREADGRLLLEIRARTDLILDLMIFRGDYYGMDDDSPVSITEPDWNEHYVGAEASISAWLTLSVATDLEAEDVEVEVTDAVRLTDDEIVSLRLERDDGESLLTLLADPPEPTEIRVDDYLPPIPLQSPIQEATVELLRPTAVRLESVDDRFDQAFACTVNVDAEADVRWLVSAPSSYDADRYAGLSEHEPGEGGWLADVETSAPITLRISAVLTFGGEWRDIEILETVLDPDEVEKRRLASDMDAAMIIETATVSSSRST